MSTIVLMRYTGLPQVINKSPTTVKTLTGNFRQPFSLMNPIIDVSGGDVQSHLMSNGVNYAMIDGKYYYIQDVTARHNQHLEIKLHLDVLMTYKDEINKLDVMLERSSTAPNDNIRDDMYPLDSNKSYTVIDLPNGFSDQEADGTYILVTNQTGYEAVK